MANEQPAAENLPNEQPAVENVVDENALRELEVVYSKWMRFLHTGHSTNSVPFRKPIDIQMVQIDLEYILQLAERQPDRPITAIRKVSQILHSSRLLSFVLLRNSRFFNNVIFPANVPHRCTSRSCMQVSEMYCLHSPIVLANPRMRNCA